MSSIFFVAALQGLYCNTRGLSPFFVFTLDSPHGGGRERHHSPVGWLENWPCNTCWRSSLCVFLFRNKHSFSSHEKRQHGSAASLPSAVSHAMFGWRKIPRIELADIHARHGPPSPPSFLDTVKSTGRAIPTILPWHC